MRRLPPDAQTSEGAPINPVSTVSSLSRYLLLQTAKKKIRGPSASVGMTQRKSARTPRAGFLRGAQDDTKKVPTGRSPHLLFSLFTGRRDHPSPLARDASIKTPCARGRGRARQRSAALILGAGVSPCSHSREKMRCADFRVFSLRCRAQPCPRRCGTHGGFRIQLIVVIYYF